MNTHLFREIESIKRKILSISAIVEENVSKSVMALIERNTNYADEIIKSDEKVDQMEVALEEECLKVLALYQPVAIDLRFIVSVLKINNDLERIGDLAVNIAKQAHRMASLTPVTIPDGINLMVTNVQLMLKISLDALIKMDPELAVDVCERDQEVDDLHKKTFSYVEQQIKENPDQTSEMIHLVGISRYLERIADHATNIAEDVIYMVEGEISRHST
ncbi:MAG: phosphate signaling complex protein PhoU [Gammaproteobacteria bacterium]